MKSYITHISNDPVQDQNEKKEKHGRATTDDELIHYRHYLTINFHNLPNLVLPIETCFKEIKLQTRDIAFK